jgi:aerobic carbon-monoxide dehydrogenase small subunit
LILTVAADGHEVVTVEGIADDNLTRLQHQLRVLSSFQCGYCAPGVILSIVELLDHTPDPTRHDVQEALSGNLCRCTGYEPIIEAVLAAAKAARVPATLEV